MRGTIQSATEELAILSNVKIDANSTLSNIIIGAGSTVEIGVTLHAGVFFEDNSNIPYNADLKELLGYTTAPYLGMKAIKLTDDVLLYSSQGGIVTAINGLIEFSRHRLSVQQNQENGYLELDAAPLHYTVFPIDVRHVWGKRTVDNPPLEAVGVTITPAGEITFVTHTGRRVQTLPIVQQPKALREALSRLGYTLSVQSNGNLKVPVTNSNYFMARPSLYSLDVPNTMPLGFYGNPSAWLNYLDEISLIFAIDTDTYRQQHLYPTAAYSEALYALAEESDSQTMLYIDGRMVAYTGKGEQKKSYQGIFDYLVTAGHPTSSGKVQLMEIEDINRDGIPDYRIIYPNGDQQLVYQCSGCLQ
jgi:hypothetical protein